MELSPLDIFRRVAAAMGSPRTAPPPWMHRVSTAAAPAPRSAMDPAQVGATSAGARRRRPLDAHRAAVSLRSTLTHGSPLGPAPHPPVPPPPPYTGPWGGDGPGPPGSDGGDGGSSGGPPGGSWGNSGGSGSDAGGHITRPFVHDPNKVILTHNRSSSPPPPAGAGGAGSGAGGGAGSGGGGGGSMPSSAVAVEGLGRAPAVVLSTPSQVGILAHGPALPSMLVQATSIHSAALTPRRKGCQGFEDLFRNGLIEPTYVLAQNGGQWAEANTGRLRATTLGSDNTAALAHPCIVADASAMIIANAPMTYDLGVFTRGSFTADGLFSGYALISEPVEGNWWLFRYDAGIPSSLIEPVPGTGGLGSASQIEIRAVGTTISAYLDGSPLDSTTDATYATGMSGMFSMSTNAGAYFTRFVHTHL